ncbi:palmitoyltransferase [Acrasis kona]|uniref:Palmitoyltransferase n=1 Tax=Acrasis kona TaxID=1008807 RepID=A0AAW2Z951_9EUKA
MIVEDSDFQGEGVLVTHGQQQEAGSSSASSLHQQNHIVKDQYKGQTLMDAAKAGDLPLMFLLISWGNKVNQVEPARGSTPLHWAAYNGHEECVNLLLQNGANPNTTDQLEGQTPFMWACMSGNLNVIKVMMEKHSCQPYNTFDAQQSSPLTHCTQNGHTLVIHYLVGKYKDKLFDRDVNKALLLDKERHTVFHWAAYNGHLSALRYWIRTLFIQVDRRSDPDIIWNWLTAVDVHKRTMLHWAARQGHANVCRVIISALCMVPGKPITAVQNVLEWRDAENHTASQWAAARHHLPVANLFLDFNRLGKKNHTSLTRDEHTSIRITDDDDEDEDHDDGALDNSALVTESNILTVRTQSNWEMMCEPKQYKRMACSIAVFPLCVIFARYLPWYISPFLIGATVIASVYIAKRLYNIGSNKAVRDASLFGVYFASVMMVAMIHITYMTPPNTSTLLFIIMLLLCVVSLSSYIYIVAANPGYIYPMSDAHQHAIDAAIGFTRDESEILELAQTGVADTKTYCGTCMIKKPLRSKHDRVTDRCVSRFDHYCSWVNMPIGSRNHVLFMVFLYSTCLLSGLFLYELIAYLVANYQGNMWESFEKNVLLFWILGYNVLVHVLLSTLLLAQTKNIFVNMTGNEMMYMDRYPWIVRIPHHVNYHRLGWIAKIKDSYVRGNAVNLFDRGWWANGLEFLFSKGVIQWDRIYIGYPAAYARSYLNGRGVSCPESVDMTTPTAIEQTHQHNEQCNH